MGHRLWPVRLGEGATSYVWEVMPVSCVVKPVPQTVTTPYILLFMTKPGFIFDVVAELLKVLNSFYRRKEVQRLAEENGLDGRMNIVYSGQFMKERYFSAEPHP